MTPRSHVLNPSLVYNRYYIQMKLTGYGNHDMERKILLLDNKWQIKIAMK